MSQFLKLSKNIINLSYVKRIDYNKEKIAIKLQEQTYDGFILFGSGFFGTNTYTINICAKEDSDDYNIVKKWIDEN